MYSAVPRWSVLPTTYYRRSSRPLLVASRASQRAAMPESQVDNVPEDGWKVAKELAEEVREDTGVQLDSEAWQKPVAADGPHEEATIWYFAFGSNMNKSVFEGRRMIKPAESVPAVLHGYRLSFNMPGLPYREPGFAGVARIEEQEREKEGLTNGNLQGNGSGGLARGSNGPSLDEAVMSSPVRLTRARLRQIAAEAHEGGSSNGSSGVPAGTGAGSSAAPAAIAAREVHGVLHRVTPKEFHYVLETEGAVGTSDFGYKVEDVDVEAYDGRVVQAQTLVCQPKSVAFLRGMEALPSQRYLSLLQVGAEEHGLAPAYQEYLRQLQPYVASSRRQQLGALLMALVFFVLVAPVFASQRLVAKVLGKKPGSNTGLRARATARYLHTVFALAWSLHDLLRPVLGCGCTNDGSGSSSGGGGNGAVEAGK